MGKATIFLAAFLAVLLVADASIYRTTVILDDEAAENPRRHEEREREHGRGQGQGQCQEQFQQQQQLSHCQEFLRREIQQQGGSRGRREEELVDVMEFENPRFGSQQLQQCCQQLEEMDSQCRCDGLRRIAQQQQQRAHLGREEMREVFHTAGSIPSQCNLSPGRCQFSGSTRIGWF